MRHQFLMEMRSKKIITIPEYIVLFNFHFGNWQEFLKNFNLVSKKRLRLLYKNGLNKILKYKKNENARDSVFIK